MPVRVVAAPEAEQDVANAYAWYEGQRVGLGEEFLGCLDACIEAVRRSPKAHATIFRRFRRALSGVFPTQCSTSTIQALSPFSGCFTHRDTR